MRSADSAGTDVSPAVVLARSPGGLWRTVTSPASAGFRGAPGPEAGGQGDRVVHRSRGVAHDWHRPADPSDDAGRPRGAGDFPDRVSAASAIFRFHGSVTVLSDKTLNLLLDPSRASGKPSLPWMTAASPAWPGSRATTWTRQRRGCDPGGRRMAASRPCAPTAAASGTKGPERGNRTVSRRDSGGQHRRAALLPRIDTDRARAAQQRRRGRADQRGRTTSHAGLTWARPRPGAPARAAIRRR